ncbi:hypothetical protein VE04_01144 [Pseudogymnoascus sp. 24MN13]|nr:hypothetical protein VE04_01144 [Pseudogymnoascus sp. 24MN13]
MSNLFSGISGRFRGAQSKTGQSKTPAGSNDGQGPPPVPNLQNSNPAPNLAPRMPPLPASPSLSSSMSLGESAAPPATNSSDPLSGYNLPRPKPLWLNAMHAKHIVKGNFMTLSAKPKTLEQGEWVAHQVVEHYRNLWLFVRVIHEKDEDGTTICNPKTCPRMSAGANHSFTWLNSRRAPVEGPAHEYISLMQRWISGKVENTDIFPTDPASVSFAYNTAAPGPACASTCPSGSGSSNAGAPIPAPPTSSTLPISALSGSDWVGKSSGFPPEFVEVCQAIFRQMFRVYAHLYWAHFTEPFYDLSLEKQLNSCFSHFILTAMALEMLKPHELDPMQPLVDLWAANGTFPPESRAYACANVEAGKRLLEISGAA